jgi:hypothetical protein
MGYDLSSRAGNHRLNVESMGKVRHLLNRAGVWSGNLEDNAGQRVSPQECLRIARALERVDAVEIAVALESYEAQRFTAMMHGFAEAAGARVEVQSPDNEQLAQVCASFSTFCRRSAAAGGFSVH